MWWAGVQEVESVMEVDISQRQFDGRRHEWAPFSTGQKIEANQLRGNAVVKTELYISLLMGRWQGFLSQKSHLAESLI
jgi:hypothetical protein